MSVEEFEAEMRKEFKREKDLRWQHFLVSDEVMALWNKYEEEKWAEFVADYH